MTERSSSDDAAIYLVGAGIASLAAAAFLIRDADIPGQNITILEESSKISGSLDAAGTPKDGYVIRGGRMIESKYMQRNALATMYRANHNRKDGCIRENVGQEGEPCHE
jgi:myosin-crossreactive antigen